MAEKKTCVFCGKLFDACTICERQIVEYKAVYGNEPWRTVCDTAECYQLYQIVRQYGFGDIDIATAHAQILRVGDLPDLSLRPSVAEQVTKILDYSPIASETKVMVEKVADVGEAAKEKTVAPATQTTTKENSKTKQTNGKSAK